jgi:dTDP-4-amino-4,6-dideoxygalactose transaminase
MEKIPFNKFNEFYLDHTKEISEKLMFILESGKYLRDKETLQLEKEIAKLCKRNFAVSTSSCTDALYFALITAGIKPQDEVILPTFSYISTLTAILKCGAVPVFVDIDKHTLTLKTEGIEKFFTEKTRAIVFVQLFGHITDLRNLKETCNQNNIILIEDSAQAIGASFEGFSGASFGDISCISFDPTKLVSAYATGGIAVTDNEDYYKTLLKIIHHGRNKEGNFEILGFNSKISELSAFMINMQLSQLDNTISKMQRIANTYIGQLSKIKEVEIILPEPSCRSTWHKFVILAQNRNQLREYLLKKGIETRIHYNPLLHEHLLLKNYNYKITELSQAEKLKNEVLSLPIYPGLKSEEINYICENIKNFYTL